MDYWSEGFFCSLDNYECYYYNNSGYMVYGSSSNGQYFGDGHDIVINNGCLSNNSSTNQYSFDYNGKNYALNGGSSFQVDDYEVYELILE